MERKLEEKLAEYYEAPKPTGKRAFVRQLGLQRMNLFHVIAMQARYISKWVWMISALFFTATCLVAQVAEWKYVSMVLAFVPFLVMLSVAESMRSYHYGMEELELSVRFSLKSIVLARMVMLGLGNLLVLAGVMLMLKGEYQVNVIYVMTPYFLTAGGGLCIVRRLRGNEGIFLCLGLAVLVCALQLYLPWSFAAIFKPEKVWVWVCACVIGIFVTIREAYRMIRMTEDLAWNY